MPKAPIIANILLDRDGTIIYDRNYLADPNGICLLPGAVEGLQALADAGLCLFLVTNQSGVGRGYFTLQDFDRVQARLYSQVHNHAIFFSGQAACFHSPEDACSCRKPKPGLWTRLSQKHGLQASESLMIGDKISDIQFAENSGLLGSILLLADHHSDQAADLTRCFGSGQGLGRHPSYIAPDLKAASQWILAHTSKKRPSFPV
ncbi:MAG: D-glycero-alpha-D-manno-heptose-1,7-bisphosphate 7-phosphatase [Desulfovermiculus sp.]